jgi:hypothetical protein
VASDFEGTAREGQSMEAEVNVGAVAGLLALGAWVVGLVTWGYSLYQMHM